MAGVSVDRGRTWRRVVVRGVSRCTGGVFDYADDVSMSAGPRGVVHLSTHVLDADRRRTDLPAGPGHADKLGQRHRRGGLGAVERRLTGAAMTADQQPMPTSAGRIGGDIDGVDQCPVIPTVAFRAGGSRTSSSR